MLAQVSDWLRVVGLEECVLFFRDAGIDGAGLLQLRQLSSAEPETFYAMADNKLGIHKFGLVSEEGRPLVGVQLLLIALPYSFFATSTSYVYIM